MPRESMPDIIVLLPGICGSALRKDGRDLWALSGDVALRLVVSRGGSLNDLTLIDDPADVDDLGDGVTADRLLNDIHLIPYLWKIDGYGRVAEFLKTTFEVEPGQNYFEFAYDWRRDNRVAARRLQRESHRWLAGWRASSGNAEARLILIAHSMGGLVSRFFLEVLDGWRDTKALITFGTPYRGSLAALDTLANGAKKGPAGLINLSSLVRSLTSVYQLLPVYECYDPGDRKLVRVGETSGIPNVDDRRAAAALAFHHEIKRAVDGHLTQDDYLRTRYKIFPIVGTHQPTQQSARRAGIGVEMLSIREGKDDKGDGTVPRVSATPLELSREGREMFAATRHASLQNADAVIAHLQGVITGLYLNLGEIFVARAGVVRLGLDIEDVYWHDEPVLLKVTADRKGPNLEATVVDGATGAEVVRTLLRADSGGRYDVECRPMPQGTYRVTVGGGPNVEPVSDVFTVFERS